MQSQMEKLTSLALVSINFALQTYIKKFLQRRTNVSVRPLTIVSLRLAALKIHVT